jgi:hypothetical protein
MVLKLSPLSLARWKRSSLIMCVMSEFFSSNLHLNHSQRSFHGSEVQSVNKKDANKNPAFCSEISFLRQGGSIVNIYDCIPAVRSHMLQGVFK